MKTRKMNSREPFLKRNSYYYKMQCLSKKWLVAISIIRPNLSPAVEGNAKRCLTDRLSGNTEEDHKTGSKSVQIGTGKRLDINGR